MQKQKHWRAQSSETRRLPKCPHLSHSFIAVRAARQAFANNPDFFGVSAERASRTLVLRFYFPRRVRRDQLDRIRQGTGWDVRVLPQTHQDRLIWVARQMPLSWEPGKVSIFAEESRVRVRVRFGDQADESEVERFRQRFERRTGWSLDLVALPEAPEPELLYDELGRMEQNAAFRLIKERYRQEAILAPHCSLRSRNGQEYILLRFATPLLGDYDPQLSQELSRQVGYQLRVSSHPHAPTLYRLAAWLSPLEWGLSDKHELLMREQLFKVECLGRPELAQAERVSEKFLEQTGYQLELVDG